MIRSLVYGEAIPGVIGSFVPPWLSRQRLGEALGMRVNELCYGPWRETRYRIVAREEIRMGAWVKMLWSRCALCVALRWNASTPIILTHLVRCVAEFGTTIQSR